MKASFSTLGLLALAVSLTSCGKRESEQSSPAAAQPVAEKPAESSAPVSASAAAPGNAKAPANGAKFATVDLQKVMSDCQPAQEARKRIEAIRNEVKSEVDERKKRLDGLTEIAGKTAKRLQNPALGKPERETLAKDLNAKRDELKALEGEFKEFTSRREKAMNEKIRTELGRILMDIRTQAQTLAQAEGYLWVIDRSGAAMSQTPAVLYVNPAFPDLTAAVTRAVDEAAKK
ncbi:MAG TPA: OmpH family outer membrane protein [Luteolibacter sp.]